MVCMQYTTHLPLLVAYVCLPAASGGFCQPFSALGSICLANPATDGCQRWASLCNTPGSTVLQCITGG